MAKSLDDFLEKNKKSEASRPPAPGPATEEDVAAESPKMSSTGSHDSKKKTAETDTGSFKIAKNQGVESSTDESEASIAAEKWKEAVAATVESTKSKANSSSKKTVKLPSTEEDEEEPVPGVKTLQPHNNVRGAVFASLLKNKDPEEVTSSAMVTEAWERLKESYVYYQNKPVGTLAAMDPTDEALNYDQGIYGYPIEIQALFYFALVCAMEMLKPDGNEILTKKIIKRMKALKFHIQTYYWLDHKRLNYIYRYKTEEYSHTAINKFNVNPESIPDWVFDFMPLQGGYFIGNVSPARKDFRWFLVGNCIAILSSLATFEQTTAIMDLMDTQWDDLIGEMPLKIVYPALQGHKWRIITGSDNKNTPWSYHNGGSWPTLLWLLAAACIKASRPNLAKRAIELAEKRLSKNEWPEHYDGKTGRYIGKQARKYQTYMEHLWLSGC